MSWGTPGAFPALKELELSSAGFADFQFPDTWGTPGAFPLLEYLGLEFTGAQGNLPKSWGTDGAFPALEHLWLTGNQQSGESPQSWCGYPPCSVQKSITTLLEQLPLCLTLAPCIQRSYGASVPQSGAQA